MPILQIGAIHLFIVIYLGIHAVKTGQSLYWLIILISFPLIGAIIYFVAIYLPQSNIQHNAQKVAKIGIKTMDPTRESREAEELFKAAPTVQNQMRLAAALFEAGLFEESVKNYEACLQGTFAGDSQIRLNLAYVLMEASRFSEALTHLEMIRAQAPNFRSEEVLLGFARALAGEKKIEEANTQFEAAYTRFGGFEITAHCALFLLANGNYERAKSLYEEAEAIIKRWPVHAKQLNARLVHQLRVAFVK